MRSLPVGIRRRVVVNGIGTGNGGWRFPILISRPLPQKLWPLSAEKANGGRKKVVVASVVAAIVLAAAGIGLLLKNNHDTDVRNASIASSSSSKAAADDAAASAAAAEADRVRTARAKRAADIKDIEASVKTMAETHVADGLFDGPVLSVSCDPENYTYGLGDVH
jgi:hypothetical protein